MRICLYTDTALPKMGAQELAVDALAREYLALGHQPVVLAPWPKNAAFADVRVPYPVLRHPRFFSSHFLTAWYRWFLQNHYERHPFDVLHCHGVYPLSYLAALSRPIVPTPVVVTSYGGDVAEKNARLRRPTIVPRMIAGLKSADALIAINSFTLERLTQLCPEAAPRIVEVPLGVHVAEFGERVPRPPELDSAIEPGSFALYRGRLKYRNGVDVLLQALARTPALDCVQLVIAGDGEDRALLEIIAEQLDLRARVRFVAGATHAIDHYLLQQARFGVVAARQCDASAAQVLEGYAAGLPMIATDLPSWSGLIEPGKTGLLVVPEAPDELADAMTHLYSEDALVQRMRVEASAFVRPYDWRLIAERHLALYRDLLPRQMPMAA